MGKRILVAVTAVLFAALSFSLFLLMRADSSISNLRASLTGKTVTLEQTEFRLQQTEGELTQTRFSLEDTKVMLRQARASLEQTEGNLTQAKSQLAQTETRLQQTNAELTQTKAQLETAKKDKFFFYYVKPEQQYGLSNLAAYLSGKKWKRAYQENVFDCSEMSALLERELEDNGFHTKIAGGISPSGAPVRHAWLLVETSPGTYTPVEATTLSIVYPDNPYFSNYFRYDRIFETIQDALNYNSTDFDWWLSY